MGKRGGYKPHGKEPYQDKHEPDYDQPYTPGESKEWLANHMADVANKPSVPTRTKSSG